jgi:abortive infection bacteriophage resistance protein
MAKTVFRQPSTDIPTQLNTLKLRGLKINNEDKVLHLLEHISYFRLSSYWYPLLALPKSPKLFNFTGFYYWSSSEYSNVFAWGQNFANGAQGASLKGGAPNVRAVRAF